MDNPLLKETFEFRPFTKPTLRYANGGWIPDDGRPDMAFILSSPTVVYVQMPYLTNLIWEWNEVTNHKEIRHYCTTDNQPWDNRRWEERNKHPNEIAGKSGMDVCCKFHSCANGRGISLTQDNEYLRHHLIIIQSSGKPVIPPKNPVCYLCLNDGRGHYLKSLWQRLWDATSNKEALEIDLGAYESQLLDAEYSLEVVTKELESVKALLVAEGESIDD